MWKTEWLTWQSKIDTPSMIAHLFLIFAVITHAFPPKSLYIELWHTGFLCPACSNDRYTMNHSSCTIPLWCFGAKAKQGLLPHTAWRPLLSLGNKCVTSQYLLYWYLQHSDGSVARRGVHFILASSWCYVSQPKGLHSEGEVNRPKASKRVVTYQSEDNAMSWFVKVPTCSLWYNREARTLQEPQMSGTPGTPPTATHTNPGQTAKTNASLRWHLHISRKTNIYIPLWKRRSFQINPFVPTESRKTISSASPNQRFLLSHVRQAPPCGS